MLRAYILYNKSQGPTALCCDDDDDDDDGSSSTAIFTNFWHYSSLLHALNSFRFTTAATAYYFDVVSTHPMCWLRQINIYLSASYLITAVTKQFFYQLAVLVFL